MFYIKIFYVLPTRCTVFTGFVWISEQTVIISIYNVNLFEPKLFFLILAHPVYKIWIIQEPNTLELWNKLHFGEKKTESIYHV